MKPVEIDVKNPFPVNGEFHVMLLERGGTTAHPDTGSALALDKTYWDVLSTLWTPVATKAKPKKPIRPRLEFRRANQSAVTTPHNIRTPATEAMSTGSFRSGSEGGHSDSGSLELNK